MESHVTNTFGRFVARLTEKEQNFSAFTARMCKIETGVASASNVSGSLLGSWPSPGQSDPVTRVRRKKAGIQDAGSTLSNCPDDENARSAVLLRFPCEQCLPGMHAWLKELQPISREESTAKEELNQLESCLRQQPSVKTLRQDSRMMAFQIRSTVLSVTPQVQFLSVNPDHQNCERSVDVLHRSGKF